jgi:L-threonylcarbamoyladenylate synthase
VSVIKIDPAKPDKEKIAAAAAIIKRGGLVIFPTETVYGIAANLLDKKAIERLYKVKARCAGKPFTVHIADLKMVRDMECEISGTAEKLTDKFWPGPLTIILKSHDGQKVGFRMPENKIALELISASGVPVVAPSANLSGRPAPVTAEDAAAGLEDKVDMVIDGGRTEVGLESTVGDLTVEPLKILRAGAIKAEDLLKAANG